VYAAIEPRWRIVDPLRFACLRETAFSLTLPPPPTGGRRTAMITFRIDPASGSGGSGSRP
jgi:hypothetical protein